MRWSYPELKKLLYLALSAFGVILLFISWRSSLSSEPASVITYLVLLIGGLVLLLFGAVTYFLRDDPDVWR
jgi:hypothetical protein